MKKSVCFMLSILLIAAAFSGCAKTEYESYTLLPNEFLLGESLSEDGKIISGTAQLTTEDIIAMNGGDCYMVFSDEGYLTFLNGTYYDGIITDHENAIDSLTGMQSLLGMSAGSEFFCVYGQKDSMGYTTYTYQQRYGECTLQNATLRIIVDPDGHTAGISCSFVPNIGIAEDVEWITPQEAEAIVDELYSGYLTIYPEHTTKLAITYDDRQYSGYAVYSDGFSLSVDAGLPYAQHFVTYDGQYLTASATAVTEMQNTDESANTYFEGMTQTTYTGEVIRFDGSIQTITVPIAYSEADNTYYLMDTERKIAVADYASFNYYGFVSLSSSPAGDAWDNNHLLAYYTYIQAYDFYNNLGIRSTDGMGVPILVLCDYVDVNGNPVDNACNMGIINGFNCFGASDANCYSEALDVCVHEFTHGVTGYSMGGNLYQNATGAINEAYSDIMGNLAEMSLGATYDTSEWLIGEMSGTILRSMSAPNAYGQPTSLSDPYYFPEVPENELDPGTNDLGGVHINNSLLSQVAYMLWEAGMSFEEQAVIWLASMEYVTPRSEYQEIYGCLLMAFEFYQVDEQYYDVVTDAFLDAELITEEEAAI